jgi:hypothetical protein
MLCVFGLMTGPSIQFFGLKRIIEGWLLGNEFFLAVVFVTGLCIGYRLDAPHL